MAWTTPRTWVTGEVVTASLMNTHVRDNDSWLGIDKPHCRVFHSANQSIANATETTLSFNSERFDVGAMHDTATNNSRITVPTGGAGKYLIGANVEWAPDAAGRRYAKLWLNGLTYIASELQEADTSTEHTQNLSTLYSLAATDFVEVRAFQNGGAALNVTAAANYSPEFWAVWVAI